MPSDQARPQFPALAPADRERILTGFNVNNQAYFGGYLGYRCVDVQPGWARLEVENHTALMRGIGT